MITLEGNCCKDCKVFTDNIEDEALKLIYSLLSSPMFKGAKIRIMPDVHMGKGITIGFSCPVGEYVNPSHVGVDVGCGIESIFFQKPLPKDKYALFEHRLKKAIPTGMKQHNETQFEEKEFLKFLNTEIQKAYQSSKGMINFIEFKKDKDIKDWCDRIGMDVPTFYHSICTLGGGNHFMEYDENDELGKFAFTVHTGSRNLGQKVHNHWAALASGPCFDKDACEKEIKEFVASWKGATTEIPEHLKAIRAKYRVSDSDGYLRNEQLKGYLTDMVVAQAYAKYNRMKILEKASEIMNKIFQKDGGNKVIDHVASVHNYIDFQDMILRKGAIRSYKGEKMIIPFNMRDGLAICEGKSNEDWNCTAPHGSGRSLSRSKAKKDIKLDDFIEEMKGIYSTSVCKNTLDEAPDAYKPTDEIIENIKDTCNILFFMKPKINIKDTSAPTEFWKK